MSAGTWLSLLCLGAVPTVLVTRAYMERRRAEYEAWLKAYRARQREEALQKARAEAKARSDAARIAREQEEERSRQLEAESTLTAAVKEACESEREEGRSALLKPLSELLADPLHPALATEELSTPLWRWGNVWEPHRLAPEGLEELELSRFLLGRRFHRHQNFSELRVRGEERLKHSANVWLTQDDRKCHNYLLGASGCGKTNVLLPMIESDIPLWSIGGGD